MAKLPELILTRLMKSLFLFFFACFALSALAQEKLQFKGNEKTKEGYLRQVVQRCRHHEEELRQCLLNTRLFSEVQISQKDETTLIELKERWSLIPFPSFQAKSGGKKSTGLFVMDGNFLGQGTLLALGGSYSPDRKSLVLFYRDPYLFGSDWSFGGSFTKQTDDIYWKNKKLETLDAFSENITQARLSLGYPIVRKGTLSLALTGRKSSYESLDLFLPPKNETDFLIGLEYQWTREKFRFYFNEGLRFYAGVDQELIGDEHKANYLQSSLLYGKGFFTDHALQCSLNVAEFNKADKRTALRPGKGRAGVKGLRGTPEGGYLTNFIFNSSFDYQVPLKMTSFGTWTLAPFVDLGFINNYLKQNEELFAQSYGVGTYFFIKGVMLPGMGLIVGRNGTFENNFFEFSIGESF